MIPLLTATTLAGCASSQPDWCFTNSPRTPTLAEYQAMDRQAKEDMRSHNAKGEKWCGWTPGD